MNPHTPFRSIAPALSACLLLAMGFAGCLGPTETEPFAFEEPVHGFEGMLQGKSSSYNLTTTFNFTGPHTIIAHDGEEREVHTVHLERVEESAGHSTRTYESRYHVDGDFQLARTDSWRISWTSDDLLPNGILWPVVVTHDPSLIERHNLEISETGDTLVIQKGKQAYHYEGGESVPFLIEGSGSDPIITHRTAFDKNEEVAAIPAWPTPEPSNETRQGHLFPGTDQQWTGLPASFQELFDGLLDHADSASKLIDAGGCVDRIHYHSPKRAPFITVSGTPVGKDVVTHKIDIQVLAPGDPDDDEEETSLVLDLDTLSPYANTTGELWRVTWTENPYQDDEVDYEKLEDGHVGFIDCEKLTDLPEPVPLQTAWERAQALPLEWEQDKLAFEWVIGYTDHGVTTPERYVFSLWQPREEETRRWSERIARLSMDAATGSFMKFTPPE